MFVSAIIQYDYVYMFEVKTVGMFWSDVVGIIIPHVIPTISEIIRRKK